MNKINIKSLLLVLTLTFSVGLFAQSQSDKEKIKSLKVAFFTERLSLSPEEASVFWPMYNEYEEKREGLWTKERKEVHDKIRVGGFNDKEANAILDRYLQIEEEQEQLDKNFYRNLTRKLSASKTLLLFKAEHDFKRRLIREYREKKGNQPEP